MPTRSLAKVICGPTHGRRSALVACAVSLVLAGLALSPGASAEPLCTDTWTGPAEGSWQTAANWSAAHVPTSTDVACVGSGVTVVVSEGANQTGVVQGAGTLVISGGSLAVTGGPAGEVSTIASLRLKGTGVLTGAGTLDVSGTSEWLEGAKMTGSGTTVLLPGSSMATLDKSTLLQERTLVNEGTIRFSPGNGAFSMSNGAVLHNKGVFNDYETGGGAIAVASGSTSEPLFDNKGTLEKTVSSGTTAFGVRIENSGTVRAASGLSGYIVFTGGGSGAGGSWSAAEFAGGSYTLKGDTFAGSVLVAGATVTVAEALHGSSGEVQVSSGSLSFATGTSTIASLHLSGTGQLTGAGTLDVSGTSEWLEGGTMSGSGTTVLLPGSSIATLAKSTLLQERTLVNEGTIRFSPGNGTFYMSNGAVLHNKGVFNDYETGGGALEVASGSTSAPLFDNEGTLEKTVSSSTTLIAVPFANYGTIAIRTGGHFIFTGAISAEASIEYGGGENPSAPGQPHPTCGKPVSCATGNESSTQTDLAIGGRGVGLTLERTYNSQAAANGAKGVFGYGWSSSFSDHLIVEPALKLATLVQASGSTVPFTEGTGGSYTAPTWTQDTLSGSAEAGYTLTYPDQTKYKFAGSGGRLESVTDRNGNATTLSYGESGRLEAITDPASRKITLAYNGEGLVESATDPMGHLVKYTYEGGNLASVVEPGETEPRWRFKYDGSHQLTELTDGRGGKTINEYNGAHQVVSQEDPLKRRLTFEYEPFRTVITNHATGSVTDERFTSTDLPVSITRAFGTASASTESFSYDASNNVLSRTDGNGHTTKYTYDAASNRTSVLDPDNNETKWTYNASHDVETTTTPKGETTTIKRDVHGNAEVVERPAPASKTQLTKYAYGTHGELTSVEDPLKRVWKYEYNAHGDRVAEIDPEADKRTWGYNEDSQETSTVSPRGVAAGGTKEAKYKTTIERDAQGRATLVIAPLKHETKYSYDANGNLATVTDPELNKTTHTYDADNEAIKVEEPNGTITETGYDGAGRVTSQTDGNKHTTTYVRNLLEQATEVIDPLGRKTLKEYDAAGNLKAVTDAAKRTTTYSFDPANRLTEVNYSEEATPDVKYEYDPDGNRTKMVDGTGTSKYTYDQLDRLTESKDGHGDVVGYEYDLANEQTKLTYPNGKAVTPSYDNAGRLKSVTDWLEHTSKFAYDADSNQTATTFPVGTSNEDTYAYNEADAMSEVKMAKGVETLASLVYARNKDGGVTKATTKGLPGEEIPAFAYDNNSRLTKGAGIAYKYDSANNATKIGTGAYTYDAASQLEKGPSLTYAYDQLGERTKSKPSSGPATTYGYDQAGVLTSVTRPHEGEVPAIEDSYGHDGDGLRASQTISGATSYMSWDAAAALPLLLNDGTSSFIYGPGDLPVEQVTGETVQYLHHDQQGSTRMITNGAGAVAATTTFDAYGNKLGSTGTATTPLGYDGQYTSADTGLIYLRARVYDPSTAQFMSVDPLNALTLAPYSYANNNPANVSDPSGLLFGISLPSINLPSWEEVGEGIAGWGDTLTLGATKWAREELGIDNVNTCSTAYQAGGYAGLATAVLIPGEGEALGAEEGVAISENAAGHIFRDAAGHLIEDTPENRALIQGAVAPENYVLTKYPGVAVYRKTLADGTQVWAEVKGGAITNGGVNQVPR